jgi:hypothetical protein
MSEATVNTTDSAPLTPLQVAEEFVKENSIEMIAEELANYHHAIESRDASIEMLRKTNQIHRDKFNNLFATLKEFIVEHIANDDSASVDELKELASECNIELTKEVTVSFTVQVEYTYMAPIDFDIESIDESNFDVSINTYDVSDDLTENNESIEICDFNVEEDN